MSVTRIDSNRGACILSYQQHSFYFMSSHKRRVKFLRAKTVWETSRLAAVDVRKNVAQDFMLVKSWQTTRLKCDCLLSLHLHVHFFLPRYELAYLVFTFLKLAHYALIRREPVKQLTRKLHDYFCQLNSQSWLYFVLSFHFFYIAFCLYWELVNRNDCDSYLIFFFYFSNVPEWL